MEINIGLNIIVGILGCCVLIGYFGMILYKGQGY